MKNILSALALTAGLFMVSCDSQLDIVPKGKTILNKVSDIELLFNQDWGLGCKPAVDIETVAGVSISMGDGVPEILANVSSLGRAYLTYDDKFDRASYCMSDGRYDDIYKWANYMNIVIANTPDAEGDESVKPRLIAEAHIMRAYLHFLGVNIYAGQYDEAKAADMGGIAYLDATTVEDVKEKLSVAEVYNHILEDIDDSYISELKDYVTSTVRIDKAFGNAVKAKVLFQMKKYDEAIPYALASLSYNDNIEDRSYIVSEMDWTNDQDSPNNILHMSGGLFVHPTMTILSRETVALFEEGDYVNEYAWDFYNTKYGALYGGLEGLAYCSGWSVNKNTYGIRVEAMHYVLGECLIRTGQIREGLAEIDKVRTRHIENATLFADKYDEEGLDEKGAMKLLQDAKVVEFIGEYDTFFDCKRWNSEADYKRTLTRDLGDYGTYSIAPDSPLWIMPFPRSATRYNPTLTQNF